MYYYGHKITQFRSGNMKNMAFAIILIYIFSFNAFAQAISSNKEMAQKMSIIDGQHTADQFESVFNVLYKYFPEGIGGHPLEETYSRICFYTLKMYDKAKEVTPDLGFYEFALGFKDFVRDSGVNGDFTQMIVLYTAGKMYGH